MAETKKTKTEKPLNNSVIGVFEINNNQYLAKTGEVIRTRISTVEPNPIINLLATIDGDSLDYGSPYLKNKVDFEVMGVVKGEKVRTNTYKAKSRTRKAVGNRPRYVEIKIKSFTK